MTISWLYDRFDTSMSPLRILVVLLYCCNALDHPLIELSGAVQQIYKCPEDNSYEDLLEAAKDYLYYLIKIKEEAKSEKKVSLKILKDTYLEGNPPLHLRNIPWDKLIEQYGWNDVQINKYFDLVSDTKLVWKECLNILEKHKEPDEIL